MKVNQNVKKENNTFKEDQENKKRDERPKKGENSLKVDCDPKWMFKRMKGKLIGENETQWVKIIG